MLNKKNTIKKLVKKNIKSSVFTHLFSIKKYKKELYLSLHPDDKNIDEKDIKIYTLSSIFTNIQINDLGLLVRDVLLLLVEAQSTWTVNILPRMIEYIGESFNRYVIETNQNIYGTKKVILPKPELYVIYTGSKPIKENKISLKKEFFNNNCQIDLNVNIITIKNSNKVIKEYIKFTKIIDSNNKKYGYTKKSINKTIEYCINKNILKEYLEEYKKEVYNIMTSVYDQKTATEMYERSLRAEGKQEGIIEGIEKGIAQGIEQGIEKGIAQGIEQGIEKGMHQGKIYTIIDLYKKNLITMDYAIKELGITEKQLLKLAK